MLHNTCMNNEKYFTHNTLNESYFYFLDKISVFKALDTNSSII